MTDIRGYDYIIVLAHYNEGYMLLLGSVNGEGTWFPVSGPVLKMVINVLMILRNVS